MTVARRQQISVFDLSSVVANLQAQQVNEISLIRAEAANTEITLRAQ